MCPNIYLTFTYPPLLLLIFSSRSVFVFIDLVESESYYLLRITSKPYCSTPPPPNSTQTPMPLLLCQLVLCVHMSKEIELNPRVQIKQLCLYRMKGWSLYRTKALKTACDFKKGFQTEKINICDDHPSLLNGKHRTMFRFNILSNRVERGNYS